MTQQTTPCIRCGEERKDVFQAILCKCSNQNETSHGAKPSIDEAKREQQCQKVIDSIENSLRKKGFWEGLFDDGQQLSYLPYPLFSSSPQREYHFRETISKQWAILAMGLFASGGMTYAYFTSSFEGSFSDNIFFFFIFLAGIGMIIRVFLRLDYIAFDDQGIEAYGFPKTPWSEIIYAHFKERQAEYTHTSFLVLHRLDRKPHYIVIDHLPVKKRELGQLVHWFMERYTAT